MAERRMFAKTIVDSDSFLEMPVTARLLYYDLGMRADDDGFVNSPKKIMRLIGASEDDMRILIARKYIIPFESGIVVIRHWKIHNYIQNDRHKDTIYTEEKSHISVTDSKIYALDTECIQNGYRLDTQVSIDKDNKDSKDKDSVGDNAVPAAQPVSRFIPPTVEEVRAYCTERNNGIDAEAFVAYYDSVGWMVGNKKMKQWKSAVITWEKKNRQSARNSTSNGTRDHSEFFNRTRGSGQ